MNSKPSCIPFSKIVAVAVLLSACALGGCGRKGPLDLPPHSAAIAVPGETPTESTAQTYRSPTSSGSAADETLFSPPSGDKRMVAPRGEKKRIILDPILD